MSAITPVGYTLLRDARFEVAECSKIGHPFTDAVAKARSAGVDTRLDRGELNKAAAFIQGLVVEDKILVLLRHPSSGQVMRVPADVLNGIPFANASGGELNFLRPGSPAFQEFVRSFGMRTNEVRGSRLLISDEHLKVAVHEAEQRRRADDKAAKRKSDKAEGRPSMQNDIKKCINEIVDEKLWADPSSLKGLTNLVRRRSSYRSVSESTVGRALHAVAIETKDPQFQRTKRQKRK